jgi:methylated-DNA-[protein]-cysteine S-methyltransferase
MRYPTMDTSTIFGVTQTPLGWAGVSIRNDAILRATLFHRTSFAAESELASFGAVPGDSAALRDALALLAAYGAGQPAAIEEFPVEIPQGTPLQRKTWLALREIPRGETRSYGWLARHVGEGHAPRAIGAAVGANPIPLWLPCHRVVASDGSLHGFGGGLAMKQSLLELEGALPPRLAFA